MTFDSSLGNHDLLEAFTDEVQSARGEVLESFDDGPRLYVRSTLPQIADVRGGDAIRGGVALRADDAEIAVHPYTFRLVCRNGAIRAEAVQTRIVKRRDDAGERLPTEILCDLREAVRACAEPAAFDESIRQMRGAMEHRADLMLMVLPFLKKLPRESGTRILADIMGRLHRGRDRSRFGLMNAVTATARDTRDAETRWRLEELGGAIPALVERPAPQRPAPAARPVPRAAPAAPAGVA